VISVPKAPDPELLHVTTRAEWQAWLAANAGRRERAVWLVFNKAHTGKPRVSYEDAVQEALAVGWIDSIIKRLDDERYAQKFTPRRPGSNWSPTNRARARKLLAEGRMTDAGKALLPEGFLAETEAGTAAAPPPAGATPQDRANRWADWQAPDWVLAGIGADPRAQAAYDRLAPSYRRRYVGWIMDAKRAETRERRLLEVVGFLAEGRELSMK
jgi:uncharacterized protein YdeI (YjbR/CyaY-like superfamily)